MTILSRNYFMESLEPTSYILPNEQMLQPTKAQSSLQTS